jgi:phospholipid/cholesterol/gamma-HCH transport system ATP-binding protein
MQEAPAVELRNVTLHYGGDDVIKEANLTVRRGEVKIILGPSGVGKSTILKAVLGLLRPKKGRIFIQGREITHMPEKEVLRMRLGMSMVFQHGALFDAMSVSDNVSYRLREFEMATPEKIEHRVAEVLRFVGLEGAKKLRPAQLSGGMRKRVAIARALAPDPELMLFDEPTVGLDPVNLFNVEQLILKLKKDRRRALIIVTHDIASAIKLGDSIVMVHEGRFIFEGTPEELRKSEDRRLLAFLDPARFHSNP